ncbi:MAG TPA: methyltransferase domain-containing protein [Syntrophorhabdaceae bacterium]|nr:methyltransferase domain-containing protein [Syntrophorhabdaceae bacterium]HOL05527.1 methyltransferase domain-containing protein [Syntrophorhabdaceae bacterium]HON84893.1 methyltransferase domain-containing protein [Syntrophorhabdaceae bacterium]HOT41467.1 methyltransferase domain-containing protein [Syntrophorhabdaceae bacterium]HPC65978.1 methyltransferase domain-containing protein [Syntrophorhabdaceae bacterium]
MQNIESEWSKVFQYREYAHRLYREVWDIPLIKKRSELIRRYLKNSITVLDVGAGKRGMEQEIRKMGIDLVYKSMDIDRGNRHDYYDLSEVSDSFHVILLFEVIEHLSLQDGIGLLKRLYELTKENGIIIASTPNIFNPSRFMRDATHKTFYAYDELCGIMNLAGYNITAVYRSYNDAFHRYILKVYLMGFMFRFFGIDYANSIFVVGQR